MRVIAEAARKPSSPAVAVAPDSQSSFRSESTPGEAHKATPRKFKVLTRKAYRVSNALGKTTASSSPPTPRAQKSPSVEEQDELDLFPEERNVLAPKKKKPAEEDDRRNAVLFGSGSVSNASPEHKPTPSRPRKPAVETKPVGSSDRSQRLSLQSMKEIARETLETRRRVA